MSYEAKPNTGTIFVEQGIFARQGVENLMASRKPILKAYINVDGKDLEIAFRFKNVWDDVAKQYTTELYTTTTGNKMLVGNIEQPYAETIKAQTPSNPLSDVGKDADEANDKDIPF